MAMNKCENFVDKNKKMEDLWLLNKDYCSLIFNDRCVAESNQINSTHSAKRLSNLLLSLIIEIDSQNAGLFTQLFVPNAIRWTNRLHQITVDGYFTLVYI